MTSSNLDLWQAGRGKNLEIAKKCGVALRRVDYWTDTLNMNMLNCRTCFVLGLVAMLPVMFHPDTSHAGEMVLHPVVMRELGQVVRSADDLHQSLVRQDDERLEIAIRDVIHQIDRVRTVAILARQHERYHLLKILEAGREHLEYAQVAYGDERRVRFEMVYQQLVNVVRIYKVDRAYGIFFCDKDKSSWVQRGAKAQNPFSSTYRTCGVRVPR